MNDRAIAEFAGRFFETGAVKKFFDDWDENPDIDQGSLLEHHMALIELAKAVRKARAEYFHVAASKGGAGQ